MQLLLHGAIAQSSQDLRVRDKILFNAKIFTANRNYPFAEAIAISGKTIVAIGNLDEVKRKMPAGTPLPGPVVRLSESRTRQRHGPTCAR